MLAACFYSPDSFCLSLSPFTHTHGVGFIRNTPDPSHSLRLCCRNDWNRLLQLAEYIYMYISSKTTHKKKRCVWFVRQEGSVRLCVCVCMCVNADAISTFLPERWLWSRLKSDAGECFPPTSLGEVFTERECVCVNVSLLQSVNKRYCRSVSMQCLSWFAGAPVSLYARVCAAMWLYVWSTSLTCYSLSTLHGRTAGVCVCERARRAGKSLLLAHSQLVNTIWDTRIHAQRLHTYIIIITRGRKNSHCEKWQPNVMVDSLHIRRTDEALCECVCVCGFERQ